MPMIVLASASPRRRELLKKLVPEFSVVVSDYEESASLPSPRDTVALFALEKAKAVYKNYPDSLVIGSDTVVWKDEILGKPKSEEDAKRMLRLLSGKTHSVFTGVALVGKNGARVEVVESKVTFKELSEETITAYVKSGSPLDKAGAYGIQDDFPLVEKFEGSYSSIMGLPVEKLEEMLKEEGIC